MGMPVRARRKFQSECGCFRPQRRFASLATVSHRQEFGAIRALSDTDLSINAGDLEFLRYAFGLTRPSDTPFESDMSKQ